MTLVLTALAPKNIVQASDRRVVLRYPSGREQPRDGHVKAVVTARFACSYSGVADLGGDTADWIAIHLSDHVSDVDGGIASVAEAAEEALRARGLQDELLEIVFVGWIGETEDVAFPSATVVTNSGPQGIESTFRLVYGRIAEGRRSAVLPIGQPLTQSEMQGVNEAVERLCREGRDNARTLAQTLTEAIRAVARGSSRRLYVSEDVLVTSLPNPRALRGALVVGKLVEDWWSVTNIPSGESRVERHGGPIIVGDRAAIQSLPPEEGPPGEGVSVAMRIVRKPENDGSLSVYILTNPHLGAAWGWPGGQPAPDTPAS